MLLQIIVTTKSAKNAKIGMYIGGDVNKSATLGASKFWSIISSNPLPIEITINNEGIIPKKVDQK